MNRTRLVTLALLPLAGCWSVGVSEEEAEQPWVRRAAVAVGELTLAEKDEYPKTEELDAYQADFHWTKPGAWFGYEVNVSYSQDDHDEPAFESETELAELDFGLRKTWLLWDLTLHPYVGGGAAALYGRRELDSPGPPAVDVDDEEWTPGVYVRAGVDWHFWKNVFVGIDYRIVREDFIDEGDLDLDYDAVTVRVGFTF
jgi:opacity protein-like surface antigen